MFGYLWVRFLNPLGRMALFSAQKSSAKAFCGGTEGWPGEASEERFSVCNPRAAPMQAGHYSCFGQRSLELLVGERLLFRNSVTFAVCF